MFWTSLDFWSPVLNYCATTVDPSSDPSCTCPPFAATHYIIFVCLLFLCSLLPPKQQLDWRPIVPRGPGSASSGPPVPPFLRSWTPASWPAVYYAATHPQSGLDRSVGWQTDSAWQWVFSLCSVHFAAYLRSGNVCCHCKFPSLTAYKQPESRAPICPPSRRPWPLFTDRRLNVRRLWALPPDSAALLGAQRLRLSGAMRRTSHRPGALREM